MTDDATDVVMTETQKELLKEIKDQYERSQEYYRDTGGKPEARKGWLTAHLPFELLREAFKGEPPVKE